jgi:hypothetical protein
MDAYSHTPANAGVQQPGLTGQVKEDIISRLGELGLHIRNGEIRFDTSLLNHDEILDGPASFEYCTLDGSWRKIYLNAGQLAFTFCQVPVVYTVSQEDQVLVRYSNGEVKQIPGNLLNRELSARMFQRTGEIEIIEVSFRSTKEKNQR